MEIIIERGSRLIRRSFWASLIVFVHFLLHVQCQNQAPHNHLALLDTSDVSSPSTQTSRDAKNYMWLSGDAVIFVSREFAKREQAEKKKMLERNSSSSSTTAHFCRHSSPFITACGFRNHFQPFVCEETSFTSSLPSNRSIAVVNCNVDSLFDNKSLPTSNQSSSFKKNVKIYVTATYFEIFVREKMPLLQSHGLRAIIYTDKEGDQSNPDGQTLPSLNMPHKANLSIILQRYYEAGTLVALHSVNLYWRGGDTTSKMSASSSSSSVDTKDLTPSSSSSKMRGGLDSKKKMKKNNVRQLPTPPRPTWSHCVPIGLPNRDPTEHPLMYIRAMKRNVLHRKRRDVERGLLFVPLTSSDCSIASKPDRTKACKAIQHNNFQLLHSKLEKDAYFDMISQHKFTLAPHGHGLDTHRITEILLMGGVPVIRKSTIVSCYDNSDNEFVSVTNNLGNPLSLPGHGDKGKDSDSDRDRDRKKMKKDSMGGGPPPTVVAPNNTRTTRTRGSLPIVIVEKWSDVTHELLHREWLRIINIPPERWDWRRLFIDHWLERIDGN